VTKCLRKWTPYL